MAEEVGALRVSVRANAAEIEGDMRRIRGVVNSASAQMQRGMVAFGRTASGAVGEIFNLRNALIGLAGGAFMSLVKRSAEYGDNIGEVAEMAGVSTDALQELRYVFTQMGVSTEDADKSMMALGKRLGEAQIKSNETSAALARLGISMADVKGKSPDQVIKLVADALPGVTDGFTRAAIVADLFGAKLGQKLLPALMRGSGFLNQLAADAHRMGLVLSGETIQKASDLSDEFNKLGTALKVAGTKGAVEMLPAFIKLREVFTSKDFQDGVKESAAQLGKLIKSMVDNRDTILKVAAAFTGMRLLKAGGIPGMIAGGVGGLVAAGVAQITPLKQAEADLAHLEKKLVEFQGIASREKSPDALIFIGKEILKLEALAEKARQKIAALQEVPALDDERTIDSRPIAPPAPLISPEVQKAISDADFKLRLLRGDFDGLADGLPEAAHGMGLFGTEVHKAATSVSGLSPELQRFNDKMLELQAAKVLDGLKTEMDKYNEELAQLNMLHGAGKLTAEQFYAAVSKARFPSLTQAVNDAGNLNKQFDGFAVNSVNTVADSLTDLATGAKTAQEAFSDMASAIIRDLIQMTIRAMLFQYVVGPLMGFAGGGAGMPLSLAPPGMPAPMPAAAGALPRTGFEMEAGGSAPIGGGINYAPVYNVNGSGPEIAALKRQMDEDRARFPEIAIKAVDEKHRRRVG